MESVNGAKFLNVTPLFLSSNRFAASSAPTAVIVIVSLTSMSHRYNHIDLTLTLKL